MKLNFRPHPHFLKVLIFIFLLFWLLYYVSLNFSEFQKLQITYKVDLFLSLLFAFLFLLINGLIFKFFVFPFNIKLNFKEWFGLGVITNMGNQLTLFRGGAALRAFYLKKRYNFPYSNFLATLAGFYILTFLVNGFCGLWILIKINYWQSYWHFLLFAFFLFLFLFSLLLLLLPLKIKMTKVRFVFLNKIINIINSWHTIKKNKLILIKLLILIFLNVLVVALKTWFEFRVFNLDISWPASFLLSIISALSLFVSLSPGALGIREMLNIAVANIIQFSPQEAVAVVLLDRAIMVFLILFLGPIFSYILLGRVFVKVN